MSKRVPLSQSGNSELVSDVSQKQEKGRYYIFVWLGIWTFLLFLGYLLYLRTTRENSIEIATNNSSLFLFLSVYSLIMTILLLAVAFTGSTEIWSTPGAYFDPTPIESTVNMNTMVTRYINYLGPLIGIPAMIIFLLLDFLIG